MVYEGADGIDDGLGGTGARESLDHHGITGGDLGDHMFLLGIRVEQKRVGFGRTQVGAVWRDRRVAFLDGPLR